MFYLTRGEEIEDATRRCLHILKSIETSN